MLQIVHSLPEIDDPLVRVIEGIYRVGGDNAMCEVCNTDNYYNNNMDVTRSLHVGEMQ